MTRGVLDHRQNTTNFRRQLLRQPRHQLSCRIRWVELPAKHYQVLNSDEHESVFWLNYKQMCNNIDKYVFANQAAKSKVEVKFSGVMSSEWQGPCGAIRLKAVLGCVRQGVTPCSKNVQGVIPRKFWKFVWESVYFRALDCKKGFPSSSSCIALCLLPLTAHPWSNSSCPTPRKWSRWLNYGKILPSCLFQLINYRET